jgi:hypothetical protein
MALATGVAPWFDILTARNTKILTYQSHQYVKNSMNLSEKIRIHFFSLVHKLFILFAENRQILLKISVIPILSTFMYLSGSTESVGKQPTQLIYSRTELIIGAEIMHICF